MVSDSRHHLSPVMPVLAGAIAVLLLATPLIGEAFAYSAEYSDSVAEKGVTARYILVTGDGSYDKGLRYMVENHTDKVHKELQVKVNGDTVDASYFEILPGDSDGRSFVLTFTKDFAETHQAIRCISLSYGKVTGTLNIILQGDQ